MKRKIFWFTVLVTTTVFAQQNGSTKDVQLEQIDVVEIKTNVASEALRIVTTLSREQIATLPVQNINELLDYLPGVDIRARGGNGVQADVSMRGGTFDQVVILLNGVNVTDPQTGHLNLDLPVDLSMVDRVEILQGTSMDILGLSAFSGAINIVTGTSRVKAVKAGVGGGSFGYFAPYAGVSYTAGKWTFTGTVSHNQSAGYVDNTDFRYSNLFLQANCRDSVSGNWNLQVGGQLKAYGANAFYSLAYPNQYELGNTFLASLVWSKRFGSFGIEASAFYRTHYDEFQLFRGKTDAPSWYVNHNHHLSNVVGGNVKGAWYSRIGKTMVGVELRNENIVSNVLGDSLCVPKNLPWYAKGDSAWFIFGKNRLNVNYFAEQLFFVGNFSASIGFSGNYNTISRNNFAFGANLGYAFAKNGRVYANVNRSLRLPTFTDLYYKSATQIASPDLKPEEALTTELGLQWSGYGLRTRLNVYYRIGQNIIDWVKTPEEAKWRSVNHSRVDAAGGEMSVGYGYGYWVKNIEASYAYCHLTKDAGWLLSKYALDYLKHKFTFNFEHGIYKGFGANWQLLYQQREGVYTNRVGETVAYNPFWTLDARLYWQNEQIKVYVEASNLTNTHYYDYGGIEQPGTWIKAGINVKLAIKNRVVQ